MKKIIAALLAKDAGLLGSARGGILLGIIGTMLVIGVVSAGVVSMIGTSGMHEVRANHATRAFYLAETGFRQIYAELRTADCNTIDEVFAELKATYGGTEGTEISIAGGGLLRIHSLNITDKNLEVAASGNQAIGADPADNQFSLAGAALGEFPPYNGVVSIEAVQDNDGNIVGSNARYHYLGSEMNNGELRLYGLKRHSDDDPALPVTVENGVVIKLAENLTFTSVGTFPGNNTGNDVRRSLTTHWPISAICADSPPSYEDGDIVTSSSIEDWNDAPGQSLGGFDDSSEYAPALVMEDVQSGHAIAAIAFRPADGTRIQTPHYEVQVKIKLDDLLFDVPTPAGYEDYKDYMMGLLFRLHGNFRLPDAKGYGVSFMRWDNAWDPGKPSGSKRLPHEVVPSDFKDGAEAGEPFLLLWKTGEGNTSFNKPYEIQWLAWAPLDIEKPWTKGVDEAEENQVKGKLLKDWVTILVRIQQVGTGADAFNRIAVMYGHEDYGGEDFASGELVWPPQQLYNPAALNGFIPVDWQAVNTALPANIQATMDTDGVTYINTAPGQYLFQYDSAQHADEIEVGLHAFGENLEDKAWFTDFAVRVAGPGGRGLDGFVPPIQN